MYSLKKVKSFRGTDGHGFNADLMKDGKKVAFVYDMADGGPMSFEWMDRENGFVPFEVKGYEGKPFVRKVTNEEREFLLYVAAQGEDGLEPEAMVVAKMLDAMEQEKDLKKACKKNTLYRLKGDAPGKWRAVNAPYSDPRVKPFLASKYGASVEEILNERFA